MNATLILTIVFIIKYDFISEPICSKIWKNWDLSPPVMIESFCPKDLLSRSIKIVKKSIIPAFFTILVTIEAVLETRDGILIRSINCCVIMVWSILYIWAISEAIRVSFAWYTGAPAIIASTFVSITTQMRYNTSQRVTNEDINERYLLSHLSLKKLESEIMINDRSTATTKGITIDAPI